MNRPLEFKAFDRKLKQWVAFFPRMTNEINEYEIVQYTGRLDKKGNKIFEGDILKVKNHHAVLDSEEYWYGVVEYDNEVCAFAVEGIKKGYSAFLIGEDMEVVGSIFEISPELAEKLS